MTARPESFDDVDGLRSGSPEAWGALCEAYSEQLWRYVARLLGSDGDAVADAVESKTEPTSKLFHNQVVEAEQGHEFGRESTRNPGHVPSK